MKKQNNNFMYRDTLDLDIEKKHKEDLGLELPKDYFIKSKNSIIDKTINNSKNKVISLSKKILLWSSAAVIALVIGFAIYNPFRSNSSSVETDILIATALADDNELDAILDSFVNDKLLTEEVFTD